MASHPSIAREDLLGSIFLIKARNKSTGKVSAIGTAFSVATSNDVILLFTAGHNLTAIRDVENNKNLAHLPPTKNEKLEKNDIFILLNDNDSIHECELLNMTSWSSYDVANLWVKLPEESLAKVKWSIDTSPPAQGREVGFIGFCDWKSDNRTVSYTMYKKTGKVIDITHQTSNKGKLPYIRTNIPIPSGCSGGPLFDLETSRVLGIASHSSSTSSEDAKGDGENNIFSPILPALGIALPPFVRAPKAENWQNPPIETGFNLVATGIIDDISNCHESIILKSPKKNKLAINFKWSYFLENKTP